MTAKKNISDTIFHGRDSLSGIQKLIIDRNYSKVFILCDGNTENYCLPEFVEYSEIENAGLLIIEQGEESKSLATITDLCTALLHENADRKTLLINLGGGVICDIGGFVASVYKRGIDFLNVPTTLMAMVDAAIGGKTGVNLEGVKNSIGLFSMPEGIYIDPDFLSTLNEEEFHSGFAEIIKHAIIADESLWNLIRMSDNFHSIKNIDDIIYRSVQIKKKIVDIDFRERSERKILNFGHTLGHAYESSSFRLAEHRLLHGNAIGLGMIGELFLSSKLAGFPEEKLMAAIDFLINHYGQFVNLINEEELDQYLFSDKKNENGKIGFYLLNDIGSGAGMFFPDEQLISEAVSFTKSILTE
jgi:3-dehydroquinate synthase